MQTFWLILVLAVLSYGLYRYYQYGESRRAAKSKQVTEEDNLLLGTSIDPKHGNPKLSRWGISKTLRRFFADFEQFRVLANRWPLIKDTPWRLQELSDTRLRAPNNASEKYGRRYDVFYNQQRAGLLEITDTTDYSTDEPRVLTNVFIRDARLIPFEDISRFLTSIAALLSAGTGDEYAEARRKIEAALDEAHGAKKIAGLTGVSEVGIEVSLLGSAVTYTTLRTREDEEIESRV
jgi:hypothetical protein